MKSFSITSCLLLFVTILQTSFAAVPTSFPPAPVKDESNNLVKATLVNGQWIPVVELPTIEIVAIKKNSTVLGAVNRNKSVMLLANLPMVEITAKALIPGKVKSVNHFGEFMITADLPVIEIVSDFPGENLITATSFRNIPTVSLPEIAISAMPKGYLTSAVTTRAGHIIPLVNLPEVTVSSYNSGGFPRFYSGSRHWINFLAEEGSRMMEKLMRNIFF